MKIEYLAVSELSPWESNPRLHSPKQVKQIAESIIEFGFNNPILIDENRVIIAGHGRLEAAKSLGLDKVPTVTLSHLNDVQRRAYVIADNQLALNASWDETLLRQQIESLKAEGFDTTVLGFELEELAGVMSKGSKLSMAHLSIDEPKTVVNVHDVWQLGPHVLVVESVLNGWPKWKHLLTDGCVLCPYPGVFAACSTEASKHPMVLVQPSKLIAAYIVDEYKALNGEGSAVRKAS